MKRTLALVLSFVLCLTTFCACAASGTGSQSESTTTTTTEATTTTEVTTTATEAVTTTTAAPAVEINREWFSEIGITFAELKEKHGAMTAMWYYNGGPIIELADGSGKYALDEGFESLDWEEIPGIASLPRGERGELLVDPFPQPKPDATISSVLGIKASDVFYGLTENVTAEKLADIYNLTHTGSELSEMEDEYYCFFTFEEFQIAIRTEEDYIITPTSLVFI